ncbi:sensor domain-containing diguanylate cyclase [Limnoglobus roseus]|uniref:diguanylate cyclase n=1 Tax=Limnoglobus roseus TaxID=2598579 RepID=A0A5C1AF43_9BACT|nr:diguanylate cyclase [Limnoglobus roseus]QEL15754.1 PAS domain S-box protein [Limnoglobus roseus]
MMIAPLPADESSRLEALRAFNVLDTPPEREYDDLTRLAATICGTPISVISLIDRDRQWFKAKVGVDAEQTSRDIAFCPHAILGRELFVVADAATDERFHDNPLVTGAPHIRFYAGAPLTTPEGFNLGTLCAIDRTPRTLTPEQQDALRVLARQVVAQLILRRQVVALANEVRERRKLEVKLRAEQDRFRAFMDHSPAIAYMKDAAGRFVFVNKTLADRFDRPVDAWVGKTDHDLFAAEFADEYRAHDVQVLAGSEAVQYSEATPERDGRITRWRSYKFPFTDASGRRMLAGMSVDVTAEKLAEDAVRASENKFRTTVDRLAEGVCVVDAATTRFVEANTALLGMLGYTAEEFLALDPFDIVAGETPDLFARNTRAMFDVLACDGRCDVGRRHYRRKDGSVVPVDLRVTVVPNGGAGLHAVIVRDITEQVEHENRLFDYQTQLEEANARLKALAVTDGLTGVKNRAAFNERLGEEFDRATRYGHPLSLILLDVDHFKAFNDTFGHPAGDEVLKIVATTLQTVARGTDFVTRYGGEEFAIVLPDTELSGALVVAERCRRALAGRSWSRRPVTASIGVGTLTPTTADSAELLAEADAALYRSKQAGRNRVSHGSGVTTPPPAAVRGS